MLKKIQGTDIEKFLKEYNAILSNRGALSSRLFACGEKRAGVTKRFLTSDRFLRIIK